MIRTQISLDKHEYDLAKIQAAALGISLAEFIRRAVREHLPVRGEGAWMKYAGFVATGLFSVNPSGFTPAKTEMMASTLRSAIGNPA